MLKIHYIMNSKKVTLMFEIVYFFIEQINL